jgi:hypothetical protein
MTHEIVNWGLRIVKEPNRGRRRLSQLTIRNSQLSPMDRKCSYS